MEFSEQIRQTASIVDIASQYTTLRKRGSKHVGLCPFHSEKTPSFTVDEEKQLFHCFGCGAGGDIFTLIMEKEGLTFPETLNYLAERYNIPLPENKTRYPQARDLKENLFKISEAAMAYFKKNLFTTAEGKKALAYLNKRKISETTVQELKIGYALQSWDGLLSFFREKKVTPATLEKAGLVMPRQKKEGYYDRFRGRIIFPIFDLSGRVVGFGGRTIFDEQPKYLNSPDTAIYSKGNLLYGLNVCKPHIREKGEIILVEGYTDFLSLYQAGIKNVAASLGTSLTSPQVSLAKRFVPSIAIAYDRDNAGIKAAVRAVSLAFEQNVSIKIVTLPPDHDPDSFIKDHGAASLLEKIEQGTPGLEFIIDAFLKNAPSATPEQKAAAARKVLTEIVKISDPIILSEYIRQTAEYLSIEERTLRSMLKQKTESGPKSESVPFLAAEKRLLQVMFEGGLAAFIFTNMITDDYKDLQSAPIFQALSAYFSEKKTPDIHDLKQKISADLFGQFIAALQEESDPSSKAEAAECISALRLFALEKRSRALKIKIAQLERQHKNEQVLPLIRQIQEIKAELSTLSQHNFPDLS